MFPKKVVKIVVIAGLTLAAHGCCVRTPLYDLGCDNAKVHAPSGMLLVAQACP